MINLVKDMINPINWVKLASEPKKIKIVLDRIFYYPGLNFNKIKPKFLQNFYKRYIISMLNQLASKNNSLKYFFYEENKNNNSKDDSFSLNFLKEDLNKSVHENPVFSCLKHNGVAIINNALSDNECDKIKKIFNNIKSSDTSDTQKIQTLDSNQKSKDVKVLVFNSNLDSLQELRSLSDFVTKNVLGKKIFAKAHFMIHQSINIPEKILKGDNNLHVDRYLPNLKIIYFPYEVNLQSAPFTYALGSHIINREYINFFKKNKNNVFDESNNDSEKFLTKKTKISVKGNSIVLTLTNGFHGRDPFQKANERSALFLTYPDFNLFSLLNYWKINSQ